MNNANIFLAMELLNAHNKQAVKKMVLHGPRGSGKTFSALILAYGLVKVWDKIDVKDSGNHSAYPFTHPGGYIFVRIGPSSLLQNTSRHARHARLLLWMRSIFTASFLNGRKPEVYRKFIPG
jgi:hypothetical protein